MTTALIRRVKNTHTSTESTDMVQPDINDRNHHIETNDDISDELTSSLIDQVKSVTITPALSEDVTEVESTTPLAASKVEDGILADETSDSNLIDLQGPSQANRSTVESETHDVFNSPAISTTQASHQQQSNNHVTELHSDEIYTLSTVNPINQDQVENQPNPTHSDEAVSTSSTYEDKDRSSSEVTISDFDTVDGDFSRDDMQQYTHLTSTKLSSGTVPSLEYMGGDSSMTVVSNKDETQTASQSKIVLGTPTQMASSQLSSGTVPSLEYMGGDSSTTIVSNKDKTQTASQSKIVLGTPTQMASSQLSSGTVSSLEYMGGDSSTTIVSNKDKTQTASQSKIVLGTPTQMASSQLSSGTVSSLEHMGGDSKTTTVPDKDETQASHSKIVLDVPTQMASGTLVVKQSMDTADIIEENNLQESTQSLPEDEDFEDVLPTQPTDNLSPSTTVNQEDLVEHILPPTRQSSQESVKDIDDHDDSNVADEHDERRAQFETDGSTVDKDAEHTLPPTRQSSQESVQDIDEDNVADEQDEGDIQIDNDDSTISQNAYNTLPSTRQSSQESFQDIDEGNVADEQYEGGIQLDNDDITVGQNAEHTLLPTRHPSQESGKNIDDGNVAKEQNERGVQLDNADSTVGQDAENTLLPTRHPSQESEKDIDDGNVAEEQNEGGVQLDNDGSTLGQDTEHILPSTGQPSQESIKNVADEKGERGVQLTNDESTVGQDRYSEHSIRQLVSQVELAGGEEDILDWDVKSESSLPDYSQGTVYLPSTEQTTTESTKTQRPLLDGEEPGMYSEERVRWKQYKLNLYPNGFNPNKNRPAPKAKAINCMDGCTCLREKGFKKSDVYSIPNPPMSGKRGRMFAVSCEMEKDGSAWTVIQRRVVSGTK